MSPLSLPEKQAFYVAELAVYLSQVEGLTQRAAKQRLYRARDYGFLTFIRRGGYSMIEKEEAVKFLEGRLWQR